VQRISPRHFGQIGDGVATMKYNFPKAAVQCWSISQREFNMIGNFRCQQLQPGAKRRIGRLVALLSSFVLVGCGENSYEELELMPSPVLYTQNSFNPFPQVIDNELQAQSKLFYVTDREKSGPDDKQPHYTNQRGQLSRAGVAKVDLSPTIRDWQQFVEITMRGKRDRKYLLNVAEVSEIGVLPYSVAELYPSAPTDTEMKVAGNEFAQAINGQLALSDSKDVHIYIHGYNVDFEYSTLVGRELEHFLGYQGAFIAYNWAATPSRLAYFKDQETATATRRNLRSLIEFLSENTDTARINLIGYSAGSRLAFEVTYQIALLNRAGSGPRLGKVILISSDLDRSFVGHALADGILQAVDQLSIYTSGTDSALAMSSFVFGRDRIGQSWSNEEGDVWPALEEALARLNKLEIIDVTDAEESSIGNGHSFFRKSPWASSDIFMSLLTPLKAGERGLVRSEGKAVWTFPEDYPQRLSGIGKP
jgi:esterase/lipase superfamily enzyme